MSNAVALSNTNQLSIIAKQISEDIFRDFLTDKRSAQTRRTYSTAVREFFTQVTGNEVNPIVLAEFLSLTQSEAISLVLQYRAYLRDKGLAPATINVRLCAIRSLVDYARKVGKCSYSLADIDGEKVITYRDTSGVTKEQFLGLRDKAITASSQDIINRRNDAILALLWENALRRCEISRLDISDFSYVDRTIKILGKARSQQEFISVTEKTANLINSYLELRKRIKTEHNALFISLDTAYKGRRLNPNAIYELIRKNAESTGIEKVVSPHRIRHSSITEALEKTNGNISAVQKFARHSDPKTTIRYDDQRKNVSLEISNLISL